MFSMEMDDFYHEIDWLTQDAKQLYVHRLAVHPLIKNRNSKRAYGLGEALAKEKNAFLFD